jgi:hypothetical protein
MQDGSLFADTGQVPLPVAAVRTNEQMGAPRRDRVQGAFVALAVARLERDHVALLAALCDLEQEQRPGRSGSVSMQALEAVLREELRQTQRALERAAVGTLGYCERCETPLAIAMLLSQPATTHCSGCAAALERGNQVH